ncbi:SMC5-SMC6 complex localization factor protein 2 isoform X2 [Danio rerio]|nr:SMC5-SMC6 complex localization factor protein 2 isoform X2 [Danio rerio]|eukprot:XP_005156664.1 SMC5-SMC6 complex localization factor protein 2 isoform X2 [Danio rerio]
MSSSLKQHITSMVKEIIPLGTPRHNLDATSHPVPGRPFLDPSEKIPDVSSSLPKSIVSSKGSESTSFTHKTSHKSSRTEQDSFMNSTVVVKRLQPNNGNINPRNNCSLSSMDKKNLLQKSSSYNRNRDISYALCKELNENLRVRGGLFQSESAVKARRHTLPHSSHRRSPERRNSLLFQQRPRNSSGQFTHNPNQKKDRMDNRDHKTSIKKELNNLNTMTSPEGRLSLSAKRKSEASTGSERETKRPRVDIQATSSSSILNSPPKFIRRAFLKSCNESVITIKETNSPIKPSISDNKPKLSSSLPRQLFCADSNAHSSQTTKSPTNAEPKDAMVARANKNPKAPPSQPHLRKVSPKSSMTFDSIETHFTPDNCASVAKMSKKTNGETEIIALSTNTSSSSHYKESVTGRSSPHQHDLSSTSFTEQASSCKMELDERAPMKAEQSRSPEAIPAVTVKVEGSGEHKCFPQWKDPLDIELGDDWDDELREHCVISLSSSSSSHEDEQLPSLKEILDWTVRVPVTPEKDAYSEPNTPVLKAVPEAVKTKATSYRNTLEQMLQEKEQYQRSKELERQLLESCEEDLMNLDEDENSESKGEDISLEHREILQRFSVTSCAIRDIHPGEEIFTPAKFGQLFNHQTLDLRKISVTPHNRSQQILLQARSEHVLSLISAGLLRKAYFSFPCQPEVTRWLFQMTSVHPNPIISSRIMQSLHTIALSAAQHIVEHKSQSFTVWVPSIRDITQVFLNMGASFISLFPLDVLQPPFTEGDLLEDFKPEENSQDSAISEIKDDATLPVHNLESVLSYLSLCTALCPKAYTDEELLLLLAVVCRIGLETHFQLLPTGSFSLLLQNVLKNITDWDVQISKACQILTDLSEDHHNLRRIVSILPESSRGKLLKRHLSVSIISKLLNHTCTYNPSGTDFKLSELKPFLPQMRPSSLLKSLSSARGSEDCDATLDQQAYYLCYSLLTLTNEASNFEFLPSAQRNDLRCLSSLLEKHIKCDIRESEKMLYRSKVKDFVARIYTKWQVLLTRTRPQEGMLYDYWKPPPEDELPSSPQGQTCIKAQDPQESPEEAPTPEWSSSESEEDDQSKDEEEEDWLKDPDNLQPLENQVKMEQSAEDCVEDVSDAEEESDVPKQQLEGFDISGALEDISEEELFEDDEDLLNEEEKQLLKDEEDRKHRPVEEASQQIEDLLAKHKDTLEMKDGMLLDAFI